MSGIRRHRLLMTRMLHSQAAMKGGRKHHGHHRDPHKGIPNVLVAHMEVRADPPQRPIAPLEGTLFPMRGFGRMQNPGPASPSAANFCCSLQAVTMS